MLFIDNLRAYQIFIDAQIYVHLLSISAGTHSCIHPHTHTHQIYVFPFLPLANDFHTNVHNISVLFIFIYLILPFFSIFQPKLLHHKSCPLAAIKYPIIYPQSICTLMDNGNGRGRYPRNWFFANVYLCA